MQKVLDLVSTKWLTIGGEDGCFEWGPTTQAVSYNNMEGLRLKAGGYTTTHWNKHFIAGGYLAYGLKDNQLKYRGDLLYSLSPKHRSIWEFPKRLFSVSYIHDLNTPGQDLQTSSRDDILNSFSRSAYILSLQKLATVYYDHEFQNHFSFRIGGKYLYDEPRGRLQYFQWIQQALSPLHVRSIRTSELDLSLRYAPQEIFIQKRDKRNYLFPGKIELTLRHRIGLKDVLGSDYSYHITEAGVGKRFFLPKQAGYMDVQLSAGKVWNRLPFPLLFIPTGNQSFIFEENDYNGMLIHEFITDRYLAGKMDFRFNWSPFSLLYDSGVKTTCGVKAIYGPLSDHNNPALHPGLFLFDPDVKPLGHTPYVEIHIGLDNLFDVLRVEWVRRLTYSGKGAFFLGSRFLF